MDFKKCRKKYQIIDKFKINYKGTLKKTMRKVQGYIYCP